MVVVEARERLCRHTDQPKIPSLPMLCRQMELQRSSPAHPEKQAHQPECESADEGSGRRELEL